MNLRKARIKKWLKRYSKCQKRVEKYIHKIEVQQALQSLIKEEIKKL